MFNHQLLVDLLSYTTQVVDSLFNSFLYSSISFYREEKKKKKKRFTQSPHRFVYEPSLGSFMFNRPPLVMCVENLKYKHKTKH